MPTVTAIVEQRRRANRRNVFLDDAFAFGCNLNVVARFRLRVGLELSAEQVVEIQRGEVRQECFDRAIAAVSTRPHSRSELRKKLMRHEYGPAIIEGVLDDLIRLNYLDDAQFARAKSLSALKNKHHGPRRAMAELIKAGVGADVARKALDDVYDPADSAAGAILLAQKHAPRLKRLEPAVARRRLAGLLQRRGYDYEVVARVVKETFADDSDF